MTEPSKEIEDANVIMVAQLNGKARQLRQGGLSRIRYESKVTTPSGLVIEDRGTLYAEGYEPPEMEGESGEAADDGVVKGLFGRTRRDRRRRG